MTAARTPPTKNVGHDSAARAPIALPCLAGATLQPKEGGGFKTVRQPPFKRKGLPSSKKLEESFARRMAKEGKLMSRKATNNNNTNNNNNNNASSGGGLEQGRTPNAAELRAGDREEFVAKMARRDDILQVRQNIVSTIPWVRRRPDPHLYVGAAGDVKIPVPWSCREVDPIESRSIFAADVSICPPR